MTLRPAPRIFPSLDRANWLVDDRDPAGWVGPVRGDGRVQLTAGQGAS